MDELPETNALRYPLSLDSFSKETSFAYLFFLLVGLGLHQQETKVFKSTRKQRACSSDTGFKLGTFSETGFNLDLQPQTDHH